MLFTKLTIDFSNTQVTREHLLVSFLKDLVVIICRWNDFQRLVFHEVVENYIQHGIGGLTQEKLLNSLIILRQLPILQVMNPVSELGVFELSFLQCLVSITLPSLS